MSDAKERNAQIARRNPDSIAKPSKAISIGALERSVFSRFPKADGEEWDISGLTVGERAVAVLKAAIALDPTVEAIEKAAKIGANVLVTHHPPYLEGPEAFGPGSSPLENPGCAVWAAITAHVSLMSFHTCLDVSKEAQVALPTILGFEPTGELLWHLEGLEGKGYGTVCDVPHEDGEPVTVSTLAARCLSILGKPPKVWGDMMMRASRVATAQGSAGSIAKAAYESDVDCVICGEMHYHDALNLSQAGVCVIELGHDVSEMPLVAVLGKAVADAGVPKADIVIIEQPDSWAFPEAIRL